MSKPFSDEEISKLKSGAVSHCMKNEVGDWITLVSRLIATIDAKNAEIASGFSVTEEFMSKKLSEEFGEKITCTVVPFDPCDFQKEKTPTGNSQ